MAQRLRELLKSPEILVCPGVYDGISAHVALESPFKALYMTGAGTTASVLGAPDLGIAGLHDFVQNGAMIVRVAGETPVICDADTGFGGPINVATTIKMYEQVGIAGLHIEDQISPKRCGHLLGKAVVSREEYASKISAASTAKSSKPSAPVIIARTDSIQPLGIDEAIHRMKQSFSLGAEVAFIEGLLNESQARRVVTELAPMPCLLNLATNGATPNWTVKQAQEMGFKIVIFPLAGCTAAVHGMREIYKEILEMGTDVGGMKGMGPRGFFEVVGLERAMEIDRKAGGAAYAAYQNQEI